MQAKMHGGMNMGQEAERDPKAPVLECAGFLCMAMERWNTSHSMPDAQLGFSEKTQNDNSRPSP